VERRTQTFGRNPSFAQKDIMARTDTIVLGAGIVGTSIALQLAKRGLGVALVDRRAPGEETSYGNAGIIEGNTVFPPAFPASIPALLRIALKRAPEANYHLRHLPQVAPWLLAFYAASRPARLVRSTPSANGSSIACWRVARISACPMP
jgi:D-amino-acid dehydrogenase